ncbi:MAG: 3-keto-disaccharide hydrolase [Thermoguttaceae bacterium]
MKNFVLSLVCLMIFVSVASAEPKVVKPFCGTCLSEWQPVKSDWKNDWQIGVPKIDPNDPRGFIVSKAEAGETAAMINNVPGDWHNAKPREGVDFYTKEKFGDCTVKLEFMIAKGSNSGVYLMGEYEVQVADSFGKPDDKLSQGDMGAIYSAAAPKCNATLEPGKWQTYQIEFVAPKFDAAGNKTTNAMFKKVTLNGKVLQENVEVEKSTGGGVTSKEAPTGPLMLQGNHGPVAYRNIEIIVP